MTSSVTQRRPTLAGVLAEPRTALQRAGVTVPAVAAVCQAVTILLTWQLWHQRSSPPNLPAVEWLSRFDYAIPLLLLALGSLVLPRIASLAFVAVLVLAMLGDQLRVLPPVMSLTLLMTLPLFGEEGIRIARWHLTALWLWAGINKLLSSGWSPTASEFIAHKLHMPHAFILVAIPLAEVSIGLTSLWPQAWKFTRWAAIALHAGIIIMFTPLFAGWDKPILPWNVALGVAAFTLFRPGLTSDRPARPYTVVAAAVLLLTPALWYFGTLDTYFTHQLFTSSVATAQVCDQSNNCDTFGLDVHDKLDVQIPPERRLFKELFDKTCKPNTDLVFTGRATIFTDPPWRGVHSCPRHDTGG